MIIQEKDFKQLLKGDEKSLEIIFYQYYKTLVSYVMRHGLEQVEAEDIVIDIFHHIWEIRQDIKSAAALDTLLFTAARNRALNVYRNLKNRQRIISKVILDEQAVNNERQDYIVEEEVTRLLDVAIKKLPRQCEQVIIGILAGKSLQEIAGEMQITLNTAKTYKLRAIKVLQDLLDPTIYSVLLLMLRLKK